MPTIVQLNERAVRDSIELVKQLAADDLHQPSTCEGWTVADLLAHMTAQHNGFAAAANGVGLDLRHWEVKAANPDEYVQAAERVIAAFGAEGATERSFHIPEFSTTRGFPGAQAIGFHLVDYVIHSWDVARSVGRAYEPAKELLDKAYEIASLVPDGPERLQPGAPFKPALANEDDADSNRWHQVLRMLGRDPNWPG
jgi:uncharacterized protein (TIGR03086 family)